jgi:hypothetical protein
LKSFRKPWIPNSARPKDLKHNEKLLYYHKNFSIDGPKSIADKFFSFGSKFGLYSESLKVNNLLKRSKSIHGVREFKLRL